VEHGAANSPASDFDSQVNHWLLPPAAPFAAAAIHSSDLQSLTLAADSCAATDLPLGTSGVLALDDLPAVQATPQREPHWLELPETLSVTGELADSHDRTLVGRLLADQMNYYSAESLTLLGTGLVVGGAMANSSIDDGIQRHFQSSVRHANSDDWFESLHSSKELGNGKYTMPVMASAWAVGELFPDSRLAGSAATWGERSLRGILVGAPPLLAMQQLTGGSRPTETGEGSEWHPFTDNNGISGHAFMGSIPFITAAKMTESKGLKAMYYAASTVVPLSRVNDNAHYPSQVALGWWMAYLAASAVDASDNPNSRWKFYPYSTGQSSGMLAEFKF